MIKYSYLQSELTKLRRKYKKENIIHHRKGIIIKNFKIPKGFENDNASLFLEIPDGFGFGINIMNCFILLDKKKDKFHLIEIGWEQMPSDLGEHFGLDKKLLKSWYWICFHLSTEEVGVYNMGTPGASPSNMVPATEYPLLIYIVLKAILEDDPKMRRMIESMNERRNELEDEYKAMMARLNLEMNWKKIPWMY